MLKISSKSPKYLTWYSEPVKWVSEQVKELQPSIINTSEDAYKIFFQNWSKHVSDREEFMCLYMNRKNKVLALQLCSVGGTSMCVLDMKILFRDALLNKASAIILAHNHPSGNLQPSNEDKQITKKICEAARVMDITVLDHIIVSPKENSYFSFADEGYL